MKFMLTTSKRLFFIVYIVLVSTEIMKAQAPTFSLLTSPVLDANINCYYRYLPRDYSIDVTKKYPLIIFIHGVGECGTIPADYTKTYVWGPGKLMNAGTFPESFVVGGNTYRFIAIMPQIKKGLDASTTDTIRPNLVDAVIEYAKANYRVDVTRVYLCGLSMGGGGTLHYAGSSLVYAKKLAAIVTACAARTISVAEATNIANANLPILNTHNNDDGTVLVSRAVSNMNRIKAVVPSITPQPKAIYWATGGHNVWQRTYENIAAGSTTGGFIGNVTDTMGKNVYEWMLQFSNPAALLPVVWKSFTASLNNEIVTLQWTISNQQNVDKYNVEKSADGNNWSEIAMVPAQKNSSSEQVYTYTDQATAKGSFFYRIKQIDLNGQYTYSSVVKIAKNKEAAVHVKIFPNPFNRQITIGLSRITENTVVVRLVNNDGHVLLKQQYVLNGTENIITLDNVKQIGKGVYYITIQNKDGATLYRSQVVKQ
jgi:Secretion system C-terminal sorting domain/Phospholipase/Carboxylesterase